jgi:UDP-2-acetamido-3-amino-2,3-dideoxy-glucuronate N-acetyltransferase
VVPRDVSPYALVYGNPAKFKSWICECGNELDFKDNFAICQCNKTYQLVNSNGVIQCKLKELP